MKYFITGATGSIGRQIVKQLVDKNIEINKEFYFDLLEDDVIVAESELGSEKYKFFICPLGEGSREKFIQLGYTEYTIENFNLSKIL